MLNIWFWLSYHIICCNAVMVLCVILWFYSGNATFINCLAMRSVGNKICVCLQLMEAHKSTLLVLLATLDSSSAIMHHSGITLHSTSIMCCIELTRLMAASSLDTHLRCFCLHSDKCRVVSTIQVVVGLCDLIVYRWSLTLPTVYCNGGHFIA